MPEKIFYDNYAATEIHSLEYTIIAEMNFYKNIIFVLAVGCANILLLNIFLQVQKIFRTVFFLVLSKYII
jgi:hypothetical protein